VAVTDTLGTAQRQNSVACRLRLVNRSVVLGALIQKLGSEICPIRPNNSFEFWIDLRLQKESGILQWFKHRTPQLIDEINYAYLTIVKS